MKKTSRKNSSFLKKSRKKVKFDSLTEETGLSEDRKRRRKIDDGIIDSEESDEEGVVSPNENGVKEESEFTEETADEKRLRVAQAYLQKIREITRREEEEEGEETDEEGKEGKRDSLVGELLQQEQLEESGRVRRLIASRIFKSGDLSEFQVLLRHRQPVTAVALSEDDTKGFSASKDGTILQWDIVNGRSEKYIWPNVETLISHGARKQQNSSKNPSKHVLTLAVSSDGRYLATGGLDRHVHLWDTRTRSHVQAFPGHRGPVSCLTFRQGTSQLFSGAFDRTINVWNVEDRAYLETLFGHQSEILTIDSLRKERVLSVARDRTMRLWKVPEQTQLVFRAPMSSLECGCFVSNEEFLSGSDDGSIELWSVLRKKHVSIVKNAHAAVDSCRESNVDVNSSICKSDTMERRQLNTENSLAQSWVSSITVCRGSDLAASGAGNGVVRLWAIENDTKSIKPIRDLPLAGFVNALAFSRSGRFLVAGIGQEPRLGRWGRMSCAQNAVAIQYLGLSDEI